jgi:hypothetical protein
MILEKCAQLYSVIERLRDDAWREILVGSLIAWLGKVFLPTNQFHREALERASFVTTQAQKWTNKYSAARTLQCDHVGMPEILCLPPSLANQSQDGITHQLVSSHIAILTVWREHGRTSKKGLAGDGQ